MIRVSNPAAMSGPTGTPRSKATPATVPTSKPATTSGWFDISFTPRPPNHATKTPMAMASNDLTLKKEPDNISALVDKGATLQNMGKFKLAVRSYDKALAVSPNNLDALLNKGSALHSDQKYQTAIECYDAALRIDKKCAMALAYKGLSLGETGQLQDAIKHFKKALSIDNHYDLANISKKMAQELLKSIKKKKTKTR